AEGKIELEMGEEKVTLKPYQQAYTNEEENDITVTNVSSLNELLWRNGEFSFENKPLIEIMKVLSRWYDMEVIFETDNRKSIRFTGILGKEQPIEEIMNI